MDPLMLIEIYYLFLFNVMHLTVKISFYEQGLLVMCMFAYSFILIIIVI